MVHHARAVLHEVCVGTCRWVSSESVSCDGVGVLVLICVGVCECVCVRMCVSVNM